MQLQLLQVPGVDRRLEGPFEAVLAHRIVQAADGVPAQPGPPTHAAPVHRQGPAGKPDDSDQLVGRQGAPATDTGPCRRYASASSVTSATTTASSTTPSLATTTASSTVTSPSADSVTTASSTMTSPSADSVTTTTSAGSSAWWVHSSADIASPPSAGFHTSSPFSSSHHSPSAQSCSP